jgi:hypothetical protein
MEFDNVNRIDESISCHANAHVLYVLAKLGCIRDDFLMKILSVPVAQLYLFFGESFFGLQSLL